jgi:hypothetical protein
MTNFHTGKRLLKNDINTDEEAALFIIVQQKTF